jgi:hypothetical protein
MSVYLDYEPFAAESIADPTLEQLLDQARSRLVGSGRLIMSLRCDDHDLSPDQISQMLPEPVSRLGRLDLISADGVQVILETLQQCRREFATTLTDVKAAAELLTAGNISEAMSRLGQALAVWAQVHDATLTSGRLIGIDYSILSVNGVRVADTMTKLVETLRSLKEAIESRDHVLLGDILQYELDETLREWEQMLDGVIEHIQGRPSL